MANITKVYLLSVPLEDDYKDTLYFANATAQHNYFAGQVVKSYTDFSYQRKDSVIRVPAQVDTIRNCNYVMYQNSAYSNKWFYAFINRMVYIDDGRTDIYISTDVLQTWMFEMQFKDSYIEREHVNDDTVGKHTIPEGLETGDFVCNDIIDFRYANTYNFPNSVSSATMMAVVMVTSLVFKYNNSTKAPEQYLVGPTWNMTNSVPQGLNVIGIPVSKETLPGLYVLKGYYDGNGRGEAINSMFLMPIQSAWAWIPYTEHLADGVDRTSDKWFYPVDSEGPNDTIANLDGDHSTSFTIPINTTINGYTPKNNKCKTSPFNYFNITNNDGVDIAFAYEDFLSTPTFKVIGSFEQGGSFMCLPTNSKKTTTANSNINGWTEGIPGGKFPQLSWTSDYYLNWQAQNGKYLQVTDTLNAINFGSNLLGGFVTGIAGNSASSASQWNSIYYNTNADSTERMLANYKRADVGGASTTGFGAVGAITDYASSVASSMQQKKVARMTPDQAKGNASTGTLSYATNAVGRFTARKMSCKYEYIKAVDSYFDMFGYKVNRLGVPLTNHRQNYWYCKTLIANIDGNIPNEDMQLIKSIYNNGITYWKNPANIKNYSVSNNIV